MYEHLFESDLAGDQCKFAEAVREQSLWEYNELVADLQTAMVRARCMLHHSCARAPPRRRLTRARCALQIVIGKEKNITRRLILSKEEMMAQQARQEECGQGSGGDDSTVLVTMEVAMSSWHAVDCRLCTATAPAAIIL